MRTATAALNLQAAQLENAINEIAWRDDLEKARGIKVPDEQMPGDIKINTTEHHYHEEKKEESPGKKALSGAAKIALWLVLAGATGGVGGFLLPGLLPGLLEDGTEDVIEGGGELIEEQTKQLKLRIMD